MPVITMLVSFALILPKVAAEPVPLQDSNHWPVMGWFLMPGHQPGHVVYVMLLKLFCFIPIGEISMRCHMASAVCGAAFCAGLVLLFPRFGLSRVSALLMCALFLRAPDLVRHMRIVENTTISMVWMLITLYLAKKWYQERSFRWWCSGVFVVSLGYSVHPFLVLWMILFVPSIWSASERKILQARFLVIGVVFVLVGLYPLVYTGIRFPLGSLKNWIDFTLMRGYQSSVKLPLNHIWSDSGIVWSIHRLTFNLGLGVCLLALIGMLTIKSGKLRLLAVFCSYFLLSLSFTLADREYRLSGCFLLILLFGAIGLEACASFVARIGTYYRPEGGIGSPDLGLKDGAFRTHANRRRIAVWLSCLVLGFVDFSTQRSEALDTVEVAGAGYRGLVLAAKTASPDWTVLTNTQYDGVWNYIRWVLRLDHYKSVSLRGQAQLLQSTSAEKILKAIDGIVVTMEAARLHPSLSAEHHIFSSLDGDEYYELVRLFPADLPQQRRPLLPTELIGPPDVIPILDFRYGPFYGKGWQAEIVGPGEARGVIQNQVALRIPLTSPADLLIQFHWKSLTSMSAPFHLTINGSAVSSGEVAPSEELDEVRIPQALTISGINVIEITTTGKILIDEVRLP